MKLQSMARSINTGREIVSGVENVVKWTKSAKNWLRERNSYTISIESNDRFFREVRDWLRDKVPQDAQKQMLLSSYPDIYYGKQLKTFYDPDDEKAYCFDLDGYKIWIGTESPSDPFMERLRQEVNKETRPSKANRSNARIVFTVYSHAAQQHLLEVLGELKAKAEEIKPTLRQLTTYGSEMSRLLERREPETVILREGQLEGILDDIDNFLHSKELFAKLGLPWHYGLLLEGPPGTGKTSIARVLATVFGLDLFYYPLSDSTLDEDFISMVSHITSKGILLLEDIDVHTALHNRTTKPGTKPTKKAMADKLTLSGVLNAVDGVMTPSGLILVITSNHEANLDPALLRPGRIDRLEHIGYTEGKQADRMFEMFYNKQPESPLEIEGLLPAAIVNIFKQHKNDPAEAEYLIREMGNAKK